MNPEMEDFFDELEAIVDSGGGQIYIGNKMQDINDIEAEAALVYLSMAENSMIKKAMKDPDYFWDMVEKGMEEMGYNESVEPKTLQQFVKEYSQTDEEDVDEKSISVVRGGKKVRINVPTTPRRRTAKQKASDRKRGRKMKGKRQKASTIRKRQRSMDRR